MWSGLLPWDHPFRMIDRVVDCAPSEWIVTQKRVSAGDPALAPGGVLPSLLLLEALGQSAALLFRLSRPDASAGGLPLLGFLEAEVHGTAAAGDAVTCEVRAEKMTAVGGVFEGSARREHELLARARLAFGSRAESP